MGLRRWLESAANAVGGRLQRWMEKVVGKGPAQPPASLSGQALGKPPRSLGPEGPPGQLTERLSPDVMDDDEARRAEDWHTLASSNVGETRYFAGSNRLEIRFLNNYYYEYFEVPAQIFRDFLFADSPGRYVWNVIRAGGFKYDRIGAGVIPSYKMPSGWKAWKEGTHGRTAKDKVARVPLPEETEAYGQVLGSHGQMIPLAQSLLGGESVKVPHVKLRLRKWANKWVMPPRGAKKPVYKSGANYGVQS